VITIYMLFLPFLRLNKKQIWSLSNFKTLPKWEKKKKIRQVIIDHECGILPHTDLQIMNDLTFFVVYCLILTFRSIYKLQVDNWTWCCGCWRNCRSL